MALSDVKKQQEVDFFVSSGDYMKNDVSFDSGWNQSGSILEPKIHKIVNPWCTFDRKIKVPSNSLDNWSLTHHIDFVDLIWMDVQGAESRVILGAKEVLKKTKYLYFEYSIFELYKKQLSLKKILKILDNFHVAQIYPRDILLVNKEYR
jgi:FkbM family methyltransferase